MQPVFTEIQLDGSQSYDPDGQPILGFLWAFVSKPAASQAALRDADKAIAYFTPDEEGMYRVSLTVSDGALVSAGAVVEIAVSASCCRPVANAGPDRLVPLGGSVTLDGTGSTDPRNQALGYAWRIVSAMPPEAQGTLTSADRPLATFTPDPTRPHARYEIELVVRNAQIASAPDLVAVDVANSKPVITEATPSQRVPPGTILTLSVTASDGDGDPLVYGWTLLGEPPVGSDFAPVVPGGPTAKLTTSSTVVAEYEVEVVANDGFENSLPARITISTGNAPPICDLQPAFQEVGHTCFANGSCEAMAALSFTVSDPDGDAPQLRWSLATSPPGVSPAFASPGAGMESITLSAAGGAIAGSYVVTLSADDPLHPNRPPCDSAEVRVRNVAPQATPGAPALVYHDVETSSGTWQYRALIPLRGGGTDPEYQGSQDGGLSAAPYLRNYWSFDAKGDPDAEVAFAPGSQATDRDPVVEVKRTCASRCAALLGTYRFSLQVTDPSGGVGTASTSTQVGNRRPVLDPITVNPTGPVKAGTSVVLGVAGRDDDRDPLSYEWTVTRPGGAPEALGSGASVVLATDPSVKVCTPGPCKYRVQVVASDGYENSDPQVAEVVIDEPPRIVSASATASVGHVCDAGGVCTTGAIELRGRAADREATQLSYKWIVSRPPNVSQTFSPPTSEMGMVANDAETVATLRLSASSGLTDPAGRTYTIQFCVNDGVNTPDVCEAVSTIVTNQAPSVTRVFATCDGLECASVQHRSTCAGDCTTMPAAAPGSQHTLSASFVLGSDARDPESAANQNLTYRWSVVSKADANANVVFAPNEAAASPTVTVFKTITWSCPPPAPGLLGDYTFALEVTDRNGATNPATDPRTVTVRVDNGDPADVNAGNPLNDVPHTYLAGGGGSPYEATVNFQGRSAGTDPNPGEPRCYDWTLSNPAPTVCIVSGGSCITGPVYTTNPTLGAVVLRGDKRLVNLSNTNPTPHSLCLRATDPWGRQFSDCKAATVTNREPTVTSLTASSPTVIGRHGIEGFPGCSAPCPGSTALSIAVTDPDGDPLEVTWSHTLSPSDTCTIADPAPCAGSCARAATVTCTNTTFGTKTATFTATVREVELDAAGANSGTPAVNSTITVSASCNCNEECVCQ